MKKLILILLLPLSCLDFKDKPITIEPQTNEIAISNSILYNEEVDYYRLEIEQAVALLKKQKQLITIELQKKDRITILAIAFPEIIRYNSFSDYIETSANRILYLNKGKKASDFSIGYFQMKPSFVEDLEKYIEKNKSLQQFNWILIRNKKEKETREERGVPVPAHHAVEQVYSDLAWGGLSQSPVFDTMFPEENDRQRIINRYACEQAGHSIGNGTIHEQTPISQPCNP